MAKKVPISIYHIIQFLGRQKNGLNELFFVYFALLNSFKAYAILNGKKITYKNFLHTVAISRIENYESKENNKDLSSTINTSELIWKIFRLYHLGRLSNFGKLTGVVTSGRSKKTTKTTILEQYRK